MLRTYIVKGHILKNNSVYIMEIENHKYKWEKYRDQVKSDSALADSSEKLACHSLDTIRARKNKARKAGLKEDVIAASRAEKIYMNDDIICKREKMKFGCEERKKIKIIVDDDGKTENEVIFRLYRNDLGTMKINEYIIISDVA